MSSSSSWVLSDRLVAACRIGDLPSATAAIADGATVDDEGRDPYGYPILPLAIAVLVVPRLHFPVLVSESHPPYSVLLYLPVVLSFPSSPSFFPVQYHSVTVPHGGFKPAVRGPAHTERDNNNIISRSVSFCVRF